MFRARGFGITLSKVTINRYVRINMIGTFPLVRGYKGLIPPHIFKLLVLAAELFMQINGVNSVANLLAWFNNFKIFLIKFGFSGIGGDGEPIFDEEMKRRILNIDETEISLDGSKTRAGGRPEVSFHDPHLPVPSLSSAKIIA
jgi:hypothetical protein